MKKTKLKLSILFTIISMIAVGFTLNGQLEMIGDLAKEAGEPMPFPLPVLYIISMAQIGVMTFGMTFLGLHLADKVNLKLPFFYSLFDKNVKFKWSKKWLLTSIFGGIIGFLIMYSLDYFLFMPYMPEFKEIHPITWWKGLLMGVLYGGIWEELAIRLFLMTLIVWLLSKLFRKKKDEIPASIYWTGIIVATLIFGLGHLPVTVNLVEVITPLVVVRAIILNGILGVFFGYLYWKKGLIYAIVAHATVHIFNYGIFTHLMNLL